MATSTDTDDTDYQTVGMDAIDFGQYAEVSLEDGGVIIYDRENSDKWIHSDYCNDLPV
ncbi:MAG: hypothetical protein V5A34_07610 [Halapricum sp.]